MAIDQKLKEPPHPAVAIVQTERPTPISLNGLMLHKTKLRGKIRKAVKRASTYLATVFSPLIKTKYFSIFINLMKFQHIYYYRLPLELLCYPTWYLKPPVFSVMNIFFSLRKIGLPSKRLTVKHIQIICAITTTTFLPEMQISEKQWEAQPWMQRTEHHLQNYSSQNRPCDEEGKATRRGLAKSTEKQNIFIVKQLARN